VHAVLYRVGAFDRRIVKLNRPGGGHCYQHQRFGSYVQNFRSEWHPNSQFFIDFEEAVLRFGLGEGVPRDGRVFFPAMPTQEEL
jgi:hypothetical protein